MDLSLTGEDAVDQVRSFYRGVIPKTDFHMHSEFSECSSDTSIEKDVTRARMVGLEKIAITDHGLVYRPEWIRSYFQEIEEARKWNGVDILTGMECDIDSEGQPVVSSEILDDFDVVIGAIHNLPSYKPSGDRFTYLPPEEGVLEEYRGEVLSALSSGWMKILAHPTDIGWGKILIPDHIQEEVASVLSRSNVAVEINFHHKDPAVSLLEKCVSHGVLLTPVSDAHNLREIGRFEWHRSIVSKIRAERILWLTL
jgi:histidinol phosphatase-like PHP family hydrolase